MNENVKHVIPLFGKKLNRKCKFEKLNIIVFTKFNLLITVVTVMYSRKLYTI